MGRKGRDGKGDWEGAVRNVEKEERIENEEVATCPVLPEMKSKVTGLKSELTMYHVVTSERTDSME